MHNAFMFVPYLSFSLFRFYPRDALYVLNTWGWENSIFDIETYLCVCLSVTHRSYV